MADNHVILNQQFLPPAAKDPVPVYMPDTSWKAPTAGTLIEERNAIAHKQAAKKV